MESTPRKLVLSALFNGRKGVRPPVGNPTSIVCHDLMDEAGVGFPEAHHNPEAMAGLALAGHEVVNPYLASQYQSRQRQCLYRCGMVVCQSFA